MDTKVSEESSVEKCKKVIDAAYQLAKESNMTPLEATQYVSNQVNEIYPRYKEARAFTEGDEKQIVLQYQSIRARQYSQWYKKSNSNNKLAKKNTKNEKTKILLWPFLHRCAETGVLMTEKQAFEIFENKGYPKNSISAMFSMLKQEFVFTPIVTSDRTLCYTTKPDPIGEKIKAYEAAKAQIDAEISKLMESKTRK